MACVLFLKKYLVIEKFGRKEGSQTSKKRFRSAGGPISASVCEFRGVFGNKFKPK